MSSNGGQASHVGKVLQVACPDAAVRDHDVPISLLGYGRQSLAYLRSGEVRYDVNVRRLVDVRGMKTKASQQTGSAQAALLSAINIDDPIRAVSPIRGRLVSSNGFEAATAIPSPNSRMWVTT